MWTRRREASHTQRRPRPVVDGRYGGRAERPEVLANLVVPEFVDVQLAKPRYQQWYLRPMAMTLRLDDEETEALRARAQLEGRSMQEVARQAVRDYVERTSRRDLLDRVLDEGLPRYAEALRRLGE